MNIHSLEWFSDYRNRPAKDRLDLYAYILGYKPLFDNNGQSIEKQEIEEFTPPTEKDLLDLYGMKG